MSSHQALRVGIAGYGIVGKRRRSFIDIHPALETVAVCDRTLSNTDHLDDGVRCYETYSELLKHDLDVLFVSMSNDIAAEVTMAGLREGLHVFCEKPPGRNVQDIENVIACEAQHPALKLKYGFNHRYHHSILDALEIIRSGELGEVINLRGVYGKSRLITFDQTSWRTKREIAGGGVLLDQGIHMVDLLRLFVGEFVEVHSFVSNNVWNFDVEDNAYAMMRTGDGKVAMLHSSASQWRHRFGLEIALTEGSLELSGILSGSKSYGEETLHILKTRSPDTSDLDEEIRKYTQDPSWESEISEFADAILLDKPVTNGSSNDALKTMELVYNIYCADADWKSRWSLDHPDQES